LPPGVFPPRSSLAQRSAPRLATRATQPSTRGEKRRSTGSEPQSSIRPPPRHQAAGGPFTGPSGRPFTGTAPRDPRGTASRGAAQRKRSGELHVAEQHVVGAVVDAERDQGGAARREHA